MVNFINPKSSFLTKYVHGFSIFDKKYSQKLSFLAFPHAAPTLALYKNTTFRVEENHIYICKDLKNEFNTLVLSQYMNPVYITYNEFVDEISIHFTPLGINYFFDKNYCEIAPERFQSIYNEKWIKFLPELFSAMQLNERLDKLEEFLLNQFRELDLTKLQKTVKMFFDESKDYKIEDITKILYITERTLRRQFNKYIGCSPVKFKRIVRFRNSINEKIIKTEISDLTRIGYKYNFYDSSHFIKEYKLFSSNIPKSFFQKVSFFDEKEYPYILL